MQNTANLFISNLLRFLFQHPALACFLQIIHLARHTFSTEVCLANGMPIETLSKLLGHTNIKITQIYAKITNEKVSKDMDNLLEKLQNIEQFNDMVI